MFDEFRLFFSRRIYDLPRREDMFVKAVAANVRHHQKKCEKYKSILELQSFSPDEIKTIDDIQNIPPLPTLFLKKHTLYSAKRTFLKSTTSGTSGTVSEMGLNVSSGIRGIGMIAGTFLTRKILSPYPANYIVLGYQPSKRNKMGAVKTAYAMTFTAPPLRREYALTDNGRSYDLNIDGIKNALIKYEKTGRPVRFIGFPPYFMFLLESLEQDGIKLSLHKKSKIILAGGWKQFSSKQINKSHLFAKSKEILGIGGESVWEWFGAVEHPIAYVNCRNHHFHVPVYSRVLIRDPDSMEVLEYGKPGLLNLITPMMTSMAFTSVLTDDIAVMYPGDKCGCGTPSPYFEVLGRVGLSDIKTCAASAAELLTSTAADEMA